MDDHSPRSIEDSCSDDDLDVQKHNDHSPRDLEYYCSDDSEDHSEQSRTQHLLHNYVPDGELFVPILAIHVVLTKGIISYSHTMPRLDAYAIQNLIDPKFTSSLVYHEYNDKNRQYPPARTIWYGFVAREGGVKKYIGNHKTRKFKCHIHSVIRQSMSTTRYLIKMVNGIVVPFDKKDKILFSSVGYYSYKDVYSPKKHDEYAPLL